MNPDKVQKPNSSGFKHTFMLSEEQKADDKEDRDPFLLFGCRCYSLALQGRGRYSVAGLKLSDPAFFGVYLEDEISISTGSPPIGRTHLRCTAKLAQTGQ